MMFQKNIKKTLTFLRKQIKIKIEKKRRLKQNKTEKFKKIKKKS